MLPSLGLSQSNNLVSPRSNPQGKGNWLANYKRIKLKKIKIKFNWSDFDGLVKVI